MLAHSAPDPVAFTDRNGVLKTLRNHGARAADFFGPSLASGPFVTALPLWWRKKGSCLRTTACGPKLPTHLGNNCCHWYTPRCL